MKKEALLKGKTKRAGRSDPRLAPYMYFFHCFADQEITMSKIFEIIATAEETKHEIATQLKGKNLTSTDLFDIDVFDGIRLESDAVSHEEVQDIFAGTLFVMLNNLLWSMATRVHKRGGLEVPKAAGRQIGRTSLFELIRAAGNNFRHYEEWHGTISKNRQLAKNIPVLKAAGLRRPWNRNMCAEIFELVGWQDEKQLSCEIRQLASEIFRNQTGIPL